MGFVSVTLSGHEETAIPQSYSVIAVTLRVEAAALSVDLTRVREVNGQGGGFYPQGGGDYRVALRDRRFFVSG